MKEQKNEMEMVLQNEKVNTEYSIYNYLKENSSVAIAILSAIIAIVTFIAKVMTWVSVK